ECFYLDLVVQYVKLLDNRTTAAKGGFYLQQHTEALMVEERHLKPLRRLRPAQPHYLERGKSGKLVSDWNIVVPPFLDEKAWEDIQ
ncbi:MAG: transcriptional regulator, partial [Kiritimatiellae bacterium]|nr:transcriptional regulator [Kiritimatiellia bacterium]